MQSGKCALCQRKRALVDSHLLPRALYKSLRNIDPDDRNPLLLNAKLLMRTSKQVSDYLLCTDCEKRIEQGGERWLLANRFHWPNSFPLQDELKSAQRVQRLGSGVIVRTGELSGIKTKQIVYFAASVFWRAAVHTWEGAHGGEHVLKLGSKYTEQLRLFLMSEAEFPVNAVLLVKVFSQRTEFANSMVFPYGERRNGCHLHRFIVPGIVFDILLGKEFPPEAPECCFLRGPGHPVFLMDDDRAIIGDVAKLMRTAVPRGKGFKSVQQKAMS